MRVEKPWGYEVWLAYDNNRYAGKYLFIKKGHRTSKQFHNKKHETIVVIKGKLELELGNRTYIYNQIDNSDDMMRIVIEPKMVHRMKGLEDTLLIEFSSPELDDVVRLEDDYNRKNT